MSPCGAFCHYAEVCVAKQSFVSLSRPLCHFAELIVSLCGALFNYAELSVTMQKCVSLYRALRHYADLCVTMQSFVSPCGDLGQCAAFC